MNAVESQERKKRGKFIIFAPDNFAFLNEQIEQLERLEGSAPTPNRIVNAAMAGYRASLNGKSPKGKRKEPRLLRPAEIA